MLGICTSDTPNLTVTTMEHKESFVWADTPCAKFRYCELATNSKRPIHSNWQTNTKSFDEVWNAHQANRSNIGLVLGNTSGVMDIDCDSLEAVALMHHLADNYLGHFKRSHDSAHYLFLCEGGGKTVRLAQPDGGVIVELRGDGGQTMVPPSTHPDGQQLFMKDWHSDASHHQYDSLYQLVHRVGALALLMQGWDVGSRHQLSLSFAGLCQSLGISYDDTYEMVQLLCHVTHDEEENARLNNVRLTYLRPTAGNIGFTGLCEVIDKASADKVSDWLCKAYGLRPAGTQVTVASHDVISLETISRPEHVNEANLAAVYAFKLQDKARYCFDNKHWYLWDGTRWKQDKQRQLLQLTTEFLQLAAASFITNGEPDVARRILTFLSAQKLENIEKLAQPKLAISLTDFDTNPMQLCVGNGVIDLETGKLMSPTPSMHHSKMAGVEHDVDASCPRFMQFLDDIFPNDEELVAYVQKVAGYLLTGSTKEQCMFMLLGGGANGKSTLVNLLTGLLGDYAANTAASTLMASNSNQYGDDLIRLNGARLITSAETENGQRFAEAKIKSFTGGDKVTGRPLYGLWVEFVPVGKIVLTTNNRPEIRGSDDGIWRRIREVPFNRQFKDAEQDRELMSALRLELPGILNWAIEGCLRWQSDGLTPPASVTASVSEYRSEMDTVVSFIADECLVAAHERTPVASLYEQYFSWCKSSGKHPHSKVQFGKALSNQGYEQVRDSTGRYWQGLSISITA